MARIGTSLAAPMFAGLVALADQGRGPGNALDSNQTLTALYNLPSSDFHEVTQDNGTTGPGYLPETGLGSPVANLLVQNLSSVAPTITAPAPPTSAKTARSSLPARSQVAVNDPAGSNEELSLFVSQGALKFGSTNGLTFINSTTNNSSSITVTGTAANLDSDLATLTYTPTSGYTGPDTLTLIDTDTSDNLTGTANVRMTVVRLTGMTQSVPDCVGAQLTLLSRNGDLMVHGGGTTANWYLVIPDSHGSTVDGTWAAMPSMTCCATVLRVGRAAQWRCLRGGRRVYAG